MQRASDIRRIDWTAKEKEALLVFSLFAAAWNRQAKKVCSRCGKLQLTRRPATGRWRRSLSWTQAREFIKWFHAPARAFLRKCLRQDREESEKGNPRISVNLDKVAEIIFGIVGIESFKNIIADRSHKKGVERVSMVGIGPPPSTEKKNYFQEQRELYKRHKRAWELRDEKIAFLLEAVQELLEEAQRGGAGDLNAELNRLQDRMGLLFVSFLHSTKPLGNAQHTAGEGSVPVGIPVGIPVSDNSPTTPTSRDQGQRKETEETQKLEQQIEAQMMTESPGVKWEDIAGLEIQKKAIQEAVIWPMQRPDLYNEKSLLKAPTGVLLFGPPGTGKTLLGKAIATESQSTFFAISVSSIISQYYGQSEKLIKTLFVVAKRRKPSVIFIDEIDSFLKQREGASSEGVRVEPP